MNKMISQLNQESKKLKNYKIEIQNKIINLPEGRLGIRKWDGCKRYFKIMGDTKTGYSEIYITNQQFDLARALAQKDYYFKTLKFIDKRLKNIDSMIKLSKNNDIMQTYNDLSPARKELVSPIEPTWEQRVQKWYETSYQKMPNRYNTPEIITKNEELVKSKTEKIISDFLYDKGIKYKYEKPLHLLAYGTVYPDFTLLSPFNFEEIYWEHFGMVDKPEYALKMVKKINLYQKNGYIIGKNLIVTFESSREVLNLDILETLVNEYFIKSYDNYPFFE